MAIYSTQDKEAKTLRNSEIRAEGGSALLTSHVSLFELFFFFLIFEHFFLLSLQ